jgi:hypothetical protein
MIGACCVVAYGACEVIARAVSRLSAVAGVGTVTSPSSLSEEGTAVLAEERSVALELLLGAMSNLAPYRAEDVLQVRTPGNDIFCLLVY